MGRHYSYQFKTTSGSYSLIINGRDPTGTWYQGQATPLTCSSPPGGLNFLQSNFSYVPFTWYFNQASSSGFYDSGTGVYSCPNGVTVQSCFKTILGQLHSQGVSGIRIFVQVCSSGSLAFSNCNTQASWNPNVEPGETWIANVGQFFQDLAGQQIYNVAITMASGGTPLQVPVAQTSSPLGSCTITGNCSSDIQSGVVYFDPLTPYGVQPNGNPIGSRWITGLNTVYNQAPTNNQNFLGWTNIFNVVNGILGKAKGAGVNVSELELAQEVNVTVFTSMMRWIYDNSMGATAPAAYQFSGTVNNQQVTFANVLAGLRAQMANNGFDSRNVAYSAAWTDAAQISGTDPNSNCTDAYGDYARDINLDSLTQAINGPLQNNGGWIGVPDVISSNGDQLVCGGTLGGHMFRSPLYSTQPNVIDIHLYPQVPNVVNTDAMVKQTAALDFGDVPTFLQIAGLTSAQVVIGETYPGTLSPQEALGPDGNLYYCPGSASAISPPPSYNPGYLLPTTTPNDSVAGFTSSSLSSYDVTFRPWMELMVSSGVCFAYGSGAGTSGNYQAVNYSGQGPYIPVYQ
jgi:hypothetical protein